MVLWSNESSVIFPEYKLSKHRPLVLNAMAQMCGVGRKSTPKTGMSVHGLGKKLWTLQNPPLLWAWISSSLKWLGGVKWFPQFLPAPAFYSSIVREKLKANRWVQGCRASHALLDKVIEWLEEAIFTKPRLALPQEVDVNARQIANATMTKILAPF